MSDAKKPGEPGTPDPKDGRTPGAQPKVLDPGAPHATSRPLADPNKADASEGQNLNQGGRREPDERDMPSGGVGEARPLTEEEQAHTIDEQAVAQQKEADEVDKQIRQANREAEKRAKEAKAADTKRAEDERKRRGVR